MEDNILKIGNTQFNKSSLAKMSEDKFKKLYKGKINVDLDEAWKIASKYSKKPKKLTKK